MHSTLQERIRCIHTQQRTRAHHSQHIFRDTPTRSIQLSCIAGEEEKDASQVTVAWAAATGAGAGDGGEPPAAPRRARNVYFESTPLHLFTGIVTERGVLTPQQAADIIRQRRDAYVRAFRLVGAVAAGDAAAAAAQTQAQTP